MMIAVIGGKRRGDEREEERRPIERIGGEHREREERADDGDPFDTPITKEEARLEAARAAIRAFKLGDAGMLDEALAAHYEACGR